MFFQEAREMPTHFFNQDCREGLKELPPESVDCCVTSPPYWGMRDYGHQDQIGLEASLDCLGWATKSDCGQCYLCHLRAVFREVRRVMKKTGTLWINLGDSYAQGVRGPVGARSTLSSGRHNQDQIRLVSVKKTVLPKKNLLGVPWRMAMALQADGFVLRQEIIWSKTCPMPDPATDRPSRQHETIFLLSLGPKYWLNKRQEGRYAKSVWQIPPDHSGRHPAAMPRDLARGAILLGCPSGGTVLDPFAGGGTTGVVAVELGCNFVGFEITPSFFRTARQRLDAASASRLRQRNLFSCEGGSCA
jgi:DNA modification methylase